MRARVSLVLLLCGVSLGLLACNAGRRSSQGADAHDAGSAVDARADLGDEMPTDAAELGDGDPGDARLDGSPGDIASSDAVDEDDTSVEMDTGTLDAVADANLAADADVAADADDAISLEGVLFAYVTEVGGRQELRLQRGDEGAVAYTLFRDEEADAFLPAFSPTGAQIAFLLQGVGGEISIRVADTTSGASFEVTPRVPLRAALEVEWADEGSLYIPAFSGDRSHTAIHLVDVNTGETRVVAEATVHLREPRRFDGGLLYLSMDALPLGSIVVDGWGGSAPFTYDVPVNVAQDLRVRGDGQTFYTDNERRLHRVTLSRPPSDAPILDAEAVTSAGVQDFHPVPVPGTPYAVSSRYPPELSVRPAPRDIYLIDLESGEALRNLSASLTRADRHPTVVRLAE